MKGLCVSCVLGQKNHRRTDTVCLHCQAKHRDSLDGATWSESTSTLGTKCTKSWLALKCPSGTMPKVMDFFLILQQFPRHGPLGDCWTEINCWSSINPSTFWAICVYSSTFFFIDTKSIKAKEGYIGGLKRRFRDSVQDVTSRSSNKATLRLSSQVTLLEWCSVANKLSLDIQYI